MQSYGHLILAPRLLSLKDTRSNFLVESDSQAAINLIQKGCLSSHECTQFVNGIQLTTVTHDIHYWEHVYKEANEVIDLRHSIKSILHQIFFFRTILNQYLMRIMYNKNK